MKTLTRPVQHYFSYPTLGLPGIYRNHYMRPLFDEGEGAGAGGDGGEGGAGGGTGGEGGAGGGDAFTGHTFTDENAQVRLPGMKAAVSVKDLATALNLRDQHGKGLETMGQIAKALKQQQDGGGAGGRPQQTRSGGGTGAGTGTGEAAATKDIFQKLESLDLLDGKTAAQTMREFANGTINPVVTALVQVMKEVKDLKGHVGTFRQSAAEGDFSTEIKSAIGTLKLPRVDDKAIAGEEVLADLARDLYSSFHPDDQPKLRGEVFAKEVQARFTQYRTFFKNLEKAELASAQKRARDMRFVRPGANSSGNGKPRKMMTNAEASAALFAGSPEA